MTEKLEPLVSEPFSMELSLRAIAHASAQLVVAVDNLVSTTEARNAQLVTAFENIDKCSKAIGSSVDTMERTIKRLIPAVEKIPGVIGSDLDTLASALWDILEEVKKRVST